MLWKSLLLMYKIFDMRTCGLSHQIKGPTTVKLAKTGLNCKIVKFTITGPLIWCDNPQVRLSKILYINNNDFHHLGRSQMCAGGCCYFRLSKPHSGTLWAAFNQEKALVGAFSVITNLRMELFEALAAWYWMECCDVPANPCSRALQRSPRPTQALQLSTDWFIRQEYSNFHAIF